MIDQRDIPHLLDLLDLLPSVHGDGSFWKQMDNDGSNYRLEKLYVFARNAREGRNDDDPRRLAECCLIFFGTADDNLVALLDGVGPQLSGGGDTGRRWVNDVTATAWRIFVPLEAERRRRDHGALGTGVSMDDWPPEAVR